MLLLISNPDFGREVANTKVQGATSIAVALTFVWAWTLKFYVKDFYVMDKALSGKLS